VRIPPSGRKERVMATTTAAQQRALRKVDYDAFFAG
jgi:hypothetical protein